MSTDRCAVVHVVRNGGGERRGEERREGYGGGEGEGLGMGRGERGRLGEEREKAWGKGEIDEKR